MDGFCRKLSSLFAERCRAVKVCLVLVDDGRVAEKVIILHRLGRLGQV